jgi:hypothetical protein
MSTTSRATLRAVPVIPCPSSMNSSDIRIPRVALSRLVVEHCSALARTSSAGSTHARAPLPASPARQGSSRRSWDHLSAHRWVARFLEPFLAPDITKTSTLLRSATTSCLWGPNRTGLCLDARGFLRKSQTASVYVGVST